MAFETAKGFVAGQAGPNYPAPVEAIKSIQKAANFGRDKRWKSKPPASSSWPRPRSRRA